MKTIITGKLIEKGELWADGAKIADNCKIDFTGIENAPVTWNFDHSNLIGVVMGVDPATDGGSISATTRLIEDDIHLTRWQRFVNWACKKIGRKERYRSKSIYQLVKEFAQNNPNNFAMGYQVIGREGNEITECKICEVSIVSNKIRKDEGK